MKSCVPCLLILSLLILAACYATSDLFKSATYHDLPLVRISSAYYKDRQVIIEYTVGGTVFDKNGINRYVQRSQWALFSYPRGEIRESAAYTIYREPLESITIRGWTRIHTIDLSREVSYVAAGIVPRDACKLFGDSIPDLNLPVVTYFLPRAIDPTTPGMESYVSIIFLDPLSGTRHVLEKEPRSSYIPEEQYHRILPKLPITLLIDALINLIRIGSSAP